MLLMLKEKLHVTHEQTITVSPEVDNLCVASQLGTPCVWFMSDPDHLTVSRNIGVTLHSGDSLVWHWFSDPIE